MPDPSPLDTIRLVFAELTGELEDAHVIACEGQAARTMEDGRRCRLRLVAALKAMLDRLRQTEEQPE